MARCPRPASRRCPSRGATPGPRSSSPRSARPDGTELNIFTTLAHHPKLLKRWSAFGGTLLYGGTLPARERELLILRTGVALPTPTTSGASTSRIGLAAGLTEEEIDAGRRRARTPPGWSNDDAVVLRAADELHADSRIGDAHLGGAGRRASTSSSSSSCAWSSASTTSSPSR